MKKALTAPRFRRAQARYEARCAVYSRRGELGATAYDFWLCMGTCAIILAVCAAFLLGVGK